MQAVLDTLSLTEPSTSGTCLAPVLFSCWVPFFPSLPEDKAIWYALLEPGMLTGSGAGQASLEHNLLWILPCFGQWTWLIPVSWKIPHWNISNLHLQRWATQQLKSSIINKMITSNEIIGSGIISNSPCVHFFHWRGQSGEIKAV